MYHPPDTVVLSHSAPTAEQAFNRNNDYTGGISEREVQYLVGSTYTEDIQGVQIQ